LEGEFSENSGKDMGIKAQFLAGGGAGIKYFIGGKHGIGLRISDIYRETNSIMGDFNMLQVSLLYQFTF